MGLQFALSFFISFFFLPSHSPRGVAGGGATCRGHSESC